MPSCQEGTGTYVILEKLLNLRLKPAVTGDGTIANGFIEVPADLFEIILTGSNRPYRYATKVKCYFDPGDTERFCSFKIRPCLCEPMIKEDFPSQYIFAISLPRPYGAPERS